MMDFLKGSVTPKDWMAVGIVAVVLVLLVVLFTFFVHNWQRSELDRVTNDLNQKISELQKARQIQANYAALKERTQKVKDLVDGFEKRLPGEAEIALLLEQFETMANEVGVSVELQTRPRSSDQKRETIPYGIVAKGTFDQIASFINRLERDKRYLKVSDLEIKEEKNGVAEATFVLSTFRFLQPPPKPAEPAGTTGSV